MLTDKELAGLVQAARLYYEDGLTQAQVAAKIGVYCRRHSAKRSCVKLRNIWRVNCATKKT